MDSCFLCRKKTTRLSGLRDIEFPAPHSRKSIRSVITYLAKLGSASKQTPDLPHKCAICLECFEYLSQYDGFVVKLLTLQKRLVRLIRDALTQHRESNRQHCHEKTIVLEDSMLNIEQYDLTSNDTVASHSDDSCDMKVIDEDEMSVTSIELKETTTDNKEESFGAVTPYCCAVCNEYFKNTADLRQHMKETHGQKRQRHTCPKCGVKVRDEEYLDLHMNLHEGKTETECRYCPKRYSRKVNVIRHMQLHYNKQKFQCEKCGLRFSQSSALYNHKLLHEAEMDPLVCGICNQTFKTRRTYKGHLKTHREDRPRFPCQFCGKTFVEKYTLKVHLKVHMEDTGPTTAAGTEKQKNTEEKTTFDCIICGSRFTNRDQYNQHMEDQHDVILKEN